MSIFDRALTGYRYAEILHGDTLQRIAFRELGDATRWAELAWINDLIPPYITDDPIQASARVLLSGGALVVPGTKEIASAEIDPYRVFEADCLVNKGLLEADDAGDFAVVGGRENLKQQLEHRIATDKGALLYHPEYGCSVRRLLGVVNGPTAALLGREYVRSALLSDFRVAEVTRSVAEVNGDRLSVDAEVQPISGRPVDISVG